MSSNLVEEVFGGGQPKEQDKKAKILERVRGLMAMATDPGATPEEADAHRAKADQLMALYAIEQWEIDTARDRGVNRPKPEVRYFDFRWFYNNQFRDDLYYMFGAVAEHCRCVVAWRGHGANERSYYEIPIIGITSDLDWFDLLFTSVLVQMGSQLEPKPDPEKSFGENAYRLRAAGMARPRIAKLLYDADMIPGLQTRGGGYVLGDDETITYYDRNKRENVTLEAGDKIPYDKLAPNKEKSLRSKVRVAGEKWGAENGHDPTTTVNPKVWQRSFAYGFRAEVNRRLRLMARMREDAPDTTNHMAVVLRDIYQMALELYKEMWPAPPPVEHGADQKRRRVSMAKVYAPKMSDRAMNAGREAGARANLSGSPQRGVTTPKRELGS